MHEDQTIKPIAQEPAVKSGGMRKEFICDAKGCTDHEGKQYLFRIGNKYATALAGFIAGAIVSAIALYPWLAFLGKICEVNN